MRVPSLGVLGGVIVLLGALPFARSAARAAPPNARSPITGDPDAAVKEFRLDDLAAGLRTMEPGAERDYFAGILANGRGRNEESIRLLRSALPSIRKSNPARAAGALESLADNYNKTFRYSDAASTYDDLLTHFSRELDHEGLQGAKDDSGVLRLLRRAPAQTITWRGPTRLKTKLNAIGSLVTVLRVNGVNAPWLLDTGANLSLVSRSFARRLGLKTLQGVAQTGSGITGIKNPVKVAVLPRLKMGGAEIRNVVLMILDDANLRISFGKRSYQIKAIVGYPVFRALGTITFLRKGAFLAGASALRSTNGARMYLKRLTPVIGCGVEGRVLPFSFDTGASSTDLSIRYYERFQSKAGSWQRTKSTAVGAGGAIRRTVFLQPELKLAIGDKTAKLDRVSIFPVKMGAVIDSLFGNLGQDLVSGFESFTLDFTRMRFALGARLAVRGSH